MLMRRCIRTSLSAKKNNINIHKSFETKACGNITCTMRFLLV